MQGSGSTPSVFQSLLRRPWDGGSIHAAAKASPHFVSHLSLWSTLEVHRGCINSVVWNPSGSLLLTGSDDSHLKLTDPFAPPSLAETPKWSLRTKHRGNIFCARFLPCGDDHIVSCSGDGVVHYTQLERTEEENGLARFRCHEGTCYQLVVVQGEGRQWMSCGEDGSVRFIDLREKERCECVENPVDVLLTTSPYPITSLAVNPLRPWLLAAGVGDSTVRIFDRRRLTVGGRGRNEDGGVSPTMPLHTLMVPHLAGKEHRLTSVAFNSTGTELLANYSSDHIYLFDLLDLKTPPTEFCSVPNPPSAASKRSSKPGKKRLRLRGDWSDTGPNARPQRETAGGSGEIAQARPTLHQSLMDRMTQVLSQMFHETGGEDDNAAGGGGGSNPGPDPREALEGLQSSFRERHNREPGAVSLSYASSATASTSTGLLSLSVGNEMERGMGLEALMSSFPSSSNSQSQSEHDQEMQPEPESQNSASLVTPSSFNTGSSPKPLQTFTGHRNARTMIKEANFYGDDHVASGSDCGHVFIWEKFSGRLVQVLLADNHVVNNVQPHPTLPILAASGIDYSVKLFAPHADEPTFDPAVAAELIRRNEIMLEETRDTITVPAVFMIRMMQCLSQLRRTRGNSARERDGDMDDV